MNDSLEDNLSLDILKYLSFCQFAHDMSRILFNFICILRQGWQILSHCLFKDCLSPTFSLLSLGLGSQEAQPSPSAGPPLHVRCVLVPVHRLRQGPRLPFSPGLFPAVTAALLSPSVNLYISGIFFAFLCVLFSPFSKVVI